MLVPGTVKSSAKLSGNLWVFFRLKGFPVGGHFSDQVIQGPDIDTDPARELRPDNDPIFPIIGNPQRRREIRGSGIANQHRYGERVNRAWPLRSRHRMLRDLFGQLPGGCSRESEQPDTGRRSAAQDIIDQRNDGCALPRPGACEHTRMVSNLVLKDALLLRCGIERQAIEAARMRLGQAFFVATLARC